jgi:hypothetical protein
MKYYTELMQIENTAIELESVYSTLKAVNCGIHELSPEEMEMALWNIEKQLETVTTKLKWQFEHLFDTVRDEDEQPVKKKKTKK